MQKFYNDIGESLSATSVRLINRIMHEAFKQAVNNGYINRNITEAVVLPKSENKEMKVFTVEEEQKLIDVLSGDRFGCAYLFALFTGMRRGEVLALKWEDYNEAERTISVNKTLNRVKNYDEDAKTKTKLEISTPKTNKSRRIIPLLSVAVELLLKQKQYQECDKSIADELYMDEGLIFATQIGTTIDPGNFSRKFKSFLKKAEIDEGTIHTMRHCFATRGLEAGVSLKVMQELLGHSSINVTGDIYTHALLETKRNELEKLENMFNDSEE